MSVIHELVEAVVYALVIAGALNWGSIAAGKGDLVAKFAPSFTIDRIVKGAVGVAGIILIVMAIKKAFSKQKQCDKKDK
jgi:uncharacterized membrane protein YuzA (DUF378 family)